MTPPPIELDLAAIAAYVTGKNVAQVQELRDRIVVEIQTIAACWPERTPKDDPGRFQLQRDRSTYLRRCREVEYLQRLLDEATR